MAEYYAEVIWERGEAVFIDNRYSRRHCLRFDGGLEVPGSSSPHSVPATSPVRSAQRYAANRPIRTAADQPVRAHRRGRSPAM